MHSCGMARGANSFPEPLPAAGPIACYDPVDDHGNAGSADQRPAPGRRRRSHATIRAVPQLAERVLVPIVLPAVAALVERHAVLGFSLQNLTISRLTGL